MSIKPVHDHARCEQSCFNYFFPANEHRRRRRGARHPKGGIIAIWIRARRFRPSIDVASRPGLVPVQFRIISFSSFPGYVVPLAAADLLARHGSLSRANLQGTFTRASRAAAYRSRGHSRSKAIQRAQPYVFMGATRGRIARLWTITRPRRIVDAHFNAISSVQSHTARLW